jgi:hypothetical protein
MFGFNSSSYNYSSFKPGMIIHTCNPSYSEYGGRKIRSWEPAWAKLARHFPIYLPCVNRDSQSEPGLEDGEEFT